MTDLPPFLKKLLVLLLYAVLQTVAILLLANSSYFQQNAIMGHVRSMQYKAWERRANWQSFLNLRTTNQELQLENTRLLAELTHLQQQKSEWESQNNRIVSVNDSFAYIPAQVVRNSINRQQNFLIINKGSLDGVEEDMGVICGNGIVGIVSHAAPKHALVISLLNTNQHFTAKLKKTGAFGTLHWDGNSYRKALLSEVPQHISVAEGDTVVSSNFSALFPPLIPIGTVYQTSVKRGTFLELGIDLFADFKTLRFVDVVVNPSQKEIKDLTRYESVDE